MTEIKFKKHALLKEEWRVRKVRIRMNILTSLPKIFEGEYKDRIKVYLRRRRKFIF